MSSDRVCEETWRQVKVVRKRARNAGANYWSEYRDSARDFATCMRTRLYQTSLSSCGAAVSHKVHNGIIELGAGTGYLSHLLRQKEVTVEAYDICPTQVRRKRVHGGTSIVHIEKRKRRHLSSVTGPHTSPVALLPTAKVIMAYDALRRFVEVGGNVFIHVVNSRD
jgi:hypothetical protein